MNELRIRQKGTLSSKLTQAHYYTWDPCNSTEIMSGSGPYYVEGEVATMSDVVTPNFKRLSSEGKIIFSPMTRDFQRIVAASFSGRTTQQPTTHLCSGIARKTENRTEFWQGPSYYLWSFPGGVDADRVEPPYLISQSDVNDFIVEKSTKVLSERGRSDHNTWEALAEINKSAKLLPGMLSSLRKAIPLGKRSEFSRSIAELWLQYRYGVRPILSDIDGVMKGLQKTVGKVRKTTRANGDLKTSRYTIHQKQFSSYGMVVGASCSDICTVRAMSLDEYQAEMAFNTGFSAKGLITLPWELIPYSFVVDWFTNVGDVLGSMVPSLALTQLGSCIVIKRETEIAITHLSDNGGTTPWNVLASANGQYFNTKINYRRTVGAFPGPKLVLRSDFKFHNITRSLDALALLLQKLRGR